MFSVRHVDCVRAVDAAKGRNAARASIEQRRDYGAAPRAPVGGPLSKSAERSMREGPPSVFIPRFVATAMPGWISPADSCTQRCDTDEPYATHAAAILTGCVCAHAGSVPAPSAGASESHCDSDVVAVESTSAEWGVRAAHSDDEEHEDGLALVYAGPPPDQQRPATASSIAQTATGSEAQHEKQPIQSGLQPSQWISRQDSTAQQPADLPPDCAMVPAEPVRHMDASGSGNFTSSDGAVPCMDSVHSHGNGVSPTAPQPSATLQAISEQEAADRAYALTLHREQVAAEAARRKRSRELLFATTGSAKHAKGGDVTRKGPLDTFVVRTPSN